MSTKKAVFVIFSSEDGRDPWSIVKHEDLPAWVIEPDNLGRLVNGEMCMKCDEGTNGSLWYRAEVGLNVWERARVQEAIEARNKSEVEFLLHIPAGQPLIVSEPIRTS